MWSYYGSKSKIVHHYAPPKHDKIIEPMAGSARYSLRYFDRQVLLVDKFDKVVRIWKYLQQCSEQDILKLPRLKAGYKINRDDFDCIEQAWLMGFMVQAGVATPNLTVSNFGAIDMPRQIKRIASDLHKIKHWEIIQGEWFDIENQKATWFIDPPYQVGGDKYVMSNKGINYQSLATWAEEREGQVIVCENSKADWMDFRPMKQMHGTRKGAMECIWTNKEVKKQEQLNIF